MRAWKIKHMTQDMEKQKHNTRHDTMTNKTRSHDTPLIIPDPYFFVYGSAMGNPTDGSPCVSYAGLGKISQYILTLSMHFMYVMIFHTLSKNQGFLLLQKNLLLLKV